MITDTNFEYKKLNSTKYVDENSGCKDKWIYYHSSY